MKTENTNDFSKCRIGDELWTLHNIAGLQDALNCEVVWTNDHIIRVRLLDGTGQELTFAVNQTNVFQSLFFSRPQFIAPPEPPRLPDYKPGQIIAVWDEDTEVPYLRKFKEFQDGKIRVSSEGSLHNTEFGWPNHCTLEELPAVLAKMEEQKYAKECGVIR